MKKNILLALMLSLLAACSNETDTDLLGTEPKLVLYCFPGTDSDTTFIHLSASIPTSRPIGEPRHMCTPDEARLTYRVNGTERPVHFLEADSLQNRPNSCFYVLGTHHCGDHVSIAASAEGFADVSAETEIPGMPEIKSVKIMPVRRENSVFDQLQVTLTDDTQSKDFYAVALSHTLEATYYTYAQDGTWQLDTTNVAFISYVNTDDEPALKPGGAIDDFFNYSNDFYQSFYIFSDEVFGSGQYTLRLNDSQYLHYYEGQDQSVLSKGVRIGLYKLAPAYYRFVKSLNDNENNVLGSLGLAPLTPTLGNVRGGLGVVGGYSVTVYEERKSFPPLLFTPPMVKCDTGAHSIDVELQNYDSWRIVIARNANYTSAHTYGLGKVNDEGTFFDGGWCTAEVPARHPRQLHVDIKAAPDDERALPDFHRSFSLELKAGERSGFLLIEQSNHDTEY